MHTWALLAERTCTELARKRNWRNRVLARCTRTRTPGARSRRSRANRTYRATYARRTSRRTQSTRAAPSMCFMCPPREIERSQLFNITGIPLKRPRGSLPPPPPPAAHVPAPCHTQSRKAPSARYSAFKALKAQRKAAAAIPEPEIQVRDMLVSEREALELANSAAAGSTHGRSAGRRVGCCIIDSVDGAGKVLVVSSNAWDLPLAPNTGICAERRAVAALMLHGKLDDSGQWTLVVSHSPCVHCAATILLFPEIKRIVYGQGAVHREPGVEMLRQSGCAVEQLAGTAETSSQSSSELEPQSPAFRRPRPLPDPTALETCEIRNCGGSLLYRAFCVGYYARKTAAGANLICAYWLSEFRLAIDARTTLIEAARQAAAHCSFVEDPGLPDGCSARVDQPLNYLEKLFFATCGVTIEVVPVCRDSDLAATTTEHARAARLDRLSAAMQHSS